MCLKRAFQYLFDMETSMNALYEKMADVDAEKLDEAVRRRRCYSRYILTNNDFYTLIQK